MAEPIRVLLVETDAEEIHTIWNLLHEKSKFQYHVEAVGGIPEALNRLVRQDIDVVLLDLSLVSHQDERDAVQAILTAQPRVAVLVLTELENEEAGLRALEGGAQDYLLKEEMATRALVRALHYAVERQRATLLVQAADKRQRAIVDSVVEYAIILLDTEGKITDWSTGAEQVFGHQADDVLGQRADLLFTPEDRLAGIPPQELVYASRHEVALSERWHIRKDARRFFASSVTRTVYDEFGNLSGFVKVVRDITERKQAEDERAALLQREQAALAEAQSAYHLLLRFIAIVAHEIGNPLTVVKRFASSLLMADVRFDQEKYREFIEIIDREADKMQHLTEQLMDTSRLKAGVLAVYPTPQPFADVIATATPQLKVLSSSHVMVVEIAEALPLVMADGERIAQVITNLVGNAAKFAPSGTTITIRAQQADDEVRVEVIDQGKGIPAEERTTIFEAFYQVEQGLRRQRGAGLGLTISKGIVEAHGGRIWIEDNTPTGVVVAFTLPTAKADKAVIDSHD
jgi:PAS domain S-box-containing protein